MRGLLLIALCLLACDTGEVEPALRGSVARIYDLSHDTVRARLADTELAIQYVSGGEVVAQVVVRVEEVELEGPGLVDLTAHGDVLGSRGGSSLPPMKSGRLQLRAYAPTAGADVRGTFGAVLETADAEFSLTGSFDTTVEDLR